MSTQVEFIVAQAKDTVLLPARLLGKPDADGLYRASVLGADGQPETRKLKIGLRNAQQVQVLLGLAAGEQLVLGPAPAQKPKPAGPLAAGAASAAHPAVAATGPASSASPATPAH